MVCEHFIKNFLPLQVICFVSLLYKLKNLKTNSLTRVWWGNNAKSASGFQADGVRLIHLEVIFIKCNEIMKHVSCDSVSFYSPLLSLPNQVIKNIFESCLQIWRMWGKYSFVRLIMADVKRPQTWINWQNQQPYTLTLFSYLYKFAISSYHTFSMMFPWAASSFSFFLDFVPHS